MLRLIVSKQNSFLKRKCHSSPPSLNEKIRNWEAFTFLYTLGGVTFGASQGMYFAGKNLMDKTKKDEHFDFVMDSSARIFFNTVFWGFGSFPIAALSIIHPAVPLLIFGGIPLSLAITSYQEKNNRLNKK